MASSSSSLGGAARLNPFRQMMGTGHVRIRVKVPQLGLTIEEVTVTTWEKQAGDKVAAGDLIATIEADKASYEIVAPADGILTELLVAEGDELAVGADLAIIEA